jgi:uncharacterized protein involved in exopolysaccharide biosynthesis/Mrp family chromosome partitioning ATPase
LQLATGFTVNDQVKVSDERFSLYEADVKFNNLIESINSPNAVALLSYKLMLHDMQDQPFRRPKNPATLSNQAFLTIAEKILTAKADSMTLLNASNSDERRVTGLLKEYGYDPKALRKGLAVKRVNFTDFVAIEFLSENPKLSAFAVNNLADEFLRYNKISRTARSSESVDFFRDLAEQKKQALDELGEKLRLYKSNNDVLNFELESATKLDQISELEKMRTQKEADINEYRLSIRRLDREIGKLSGANSMDNKGSDNQKIVRLKNQIGDMNSRYIAGGSSNRALLDSISVFRQQMQREMSNSSTTSANEGGVSPAAKMRELIEKKSELETSLEITESNLASVSGKLNALKYNVSGFANKEATMANIQREIDVATKEYSEAQEKFNLAQNTASAGNPLRVILAGLPPAEHEPSKTIIVTILAGVASFFLCAFTIIFLEFVDTRVKSPFYFQKSVNMNLAGTLNVIKGNTDFAFLFDKNITDNNLLTFKQLIRKLRFEIERQESKVIMVTSLKQGEGKTFTILGLAFSLSLIQKKVLIIDTNFKNTTLTKLLVKSKFKKLKGANGAEEANQLLSHEPEEDFGKDRDFITHTKYKNIHVIGSRVDNDSPSEILSGRDFLGMLTELRMVYDYIFLEGAAMNDFPDTKELIGYADKVVAVFSAESVVKQLDKESISYLSQFNGKLVGAVLNRVEVKDLDL